MDLPRLFRDPFRRHPPNYRTHLRAWLESPAGLRLLAAQSAVLDEVTPCIFGFHAVQLCAARPVSLLDGSRILHRVHVATGDLQADGVAPADAACVQVRADSASLPFADSSLDLLVLHHALDFEDDPHGVLREAARAVIPGGALVVVGFNPWSWFGLLRFFHLGALDAPWFARCISPWRVSDWLRLLDFRVDGLECGYHLPPVTGERTEQRLTWLRALGERFWPRTGMFYVLVARKSVAPLTPVRRTVRQQRPVSVGVPVAGRVTRHDGTS